MTCERETDWGILQEVGKG